MTSTVQDGGIVLVGGEPVFSLLKNLLEEQLKFGFVPMVEGEPAPLGRVSLHLLFLATMQCYGIELALVVRVPDSLFPTGGNHPDQHGLDIGIGREPDTAVRRPELGLKGVDVIVNIQTFVSYGVAAPKIVLTISLPHRSVARSK